MDAQNPAYANQMAISPALLEEVAEDPKVLTRYRRKMAMALLVRLQHRMMSGDATASAQIQYMELLLRPDDAAAKAAASAPAQAGPALEIRINFSKSSAASPVATPAVVIENATTEVTDA